MSALEEDVFKNLIVQGDEKAFSSFYELFWEPLYLYVFKVLQDQEEAMDVVQETFVAVWQQRHQVLLTHSISSYIYSIARYKAFSVIRKNIKQKDYLASLIDFFDQYAQTPEEIMISKQLQHLLDEQIDTLPPKMKEIFLLSREAQLSYKEIAEKLNISDKTVKKQISNSLKIIRMRLDSAQVTVLISSIMSQTLPHA
jgi:RNA polymerase sigma-70 factor (ECF subfamily)